MTIFLALALNLAHARPPDDELGRALGVLKARVTVVDHSRVGELDAWGSWTWRHAMLLAGFAALPIAKAPPQQRMQDTLLRIARVAVRTGGTVWLVARLGRALRSRAKPAALDAYRSAEGFQNFLLLQLDQQYALAATDAEYARFLIDLAADLERVAHPVPPSARKN